MLSQKDLESPRHQEVICICGRRKFFETDSVLDQARSGRPETRKETCAGVQESLQQSPKKSTRKRSAELGIPRATMMDHMKKDLDVKAYKPMSVNQLSDEDMF